MNSDRTLGSVVHKVLGHYSSFILVHLFTMKDFLHLKDIYRVISYLSGHGSIEQ